MIPAHQDGTATIYAGANLDVLPHLADQSIDCVVTSPPYFGLRDYGVEGQYGSEETPAEFVANLVATFREVHRVLADDGTVWLNLGDSYAQPGRSGTQGMTGQRADRRFTPSGHGASGRPPKNLLGIPWRVAFGLQDDGWILRNDIVWEKPNTKPEAVRDRMRMQHEYVFMFSKSRRYWYDLDAVKVPSRAADPSHAQRYAKRYQAFDERASTTGQPGNQNHVGLHSRPGNGMVNPGTVWKISTVPFRGAHFATFPPELPRRCIKAGCRPGGTVLDPFHGAGTTGMVARELGRNYVGIELNPASVDLSLRTRMSVA